MLSDKVRNGIYIGLYLANTAVVACVQQNVLSAQYLGVALAVSLVMTSMMKQFGHVTAPPADGAVK